MRGQNSRDAGTGANSDRRHFLRAAGLGVMAALAPRGLAAPAAPAGFAEIAPGVFVHSGRVALTSPENGGDISNYAFVVGTEGVAVIDTGTSAKIGASIREAIGQVTPLPVRFVINTHMHPDHVFGNAAFEGGDVKFIAHHKMARGLTARADTYLRRLREQLGASEFEGTKVVLPNVAISETTTIDLGGRTLELVPRPTAHTDNDLTIQDTATGTLFLGDLLFAKHVPTLDGSIVGWLSLIETLKQIPAARVVPGHGPETMAWPDAMEPQQRYLALIASEVRTMLKANKTLSEATATVGLAERSNWGAFDDHHARNVTAAFAELEWE